MDQQLLIYIEQELKRGSQPDAVKKALCDAGWESALVQEAFAAVQSKTVAPLPQNISSAPEKEVAGKGEEFLPEKKEFLSEAKIIFGIAALIFAGIAVYLYLLDSFKSPEIKNEDLFIEENAGLDSVAPAESPDGNEPALQAEEGGFGQGDTQNDVSGDVVSAVTTETASLDSVQTGDEQRKADMQKLVEAQKSWFAVQGKYYTCGLSGGDCGGKVRGYPSQIGDLAVMPQDPSGVATGVCGKDFVYCGLNNAPYSHFFCYYAKLESGGYYTASHEGNFLRQTPPKIFEDCAVSD